MLISKRHSRIFFRSFISLALLGSTSLVGNAQSSAAPSTGQETAPHRPTGTASITPGTSGNRFAISNGDLIEVSVYGVPELSQKTRVNSSGDLYMPLVGYIHVEGMTVADAQAAIEKRLVDGGFIKNPHVSLFTSEYAQGVSIMGEVNRPGVYPLVGSHNLLDLISTAQGLTPAAGRGISIIRRSDPTHAIKVNLSSDLAQTLGGNVEVQQGDTVVVSKGAIVYIVGEVIKPSGFVIDPDQGLTITRVLAMALGPLRGASLDKTKIVRRTPTGLQEVPVNLKKLMRSNGQDIPLQADDIVFIPGAGAGRNAARRSLEAIVQVTTGLAIYAPK